MKCVMCGAKLKTYKEAHPYDIGLDRPVVIAGMELARCPQCGEEYLGLSKIEDLHKLVARNVADKKARLTAKEIRFLRSWLGFSGADFARELGVSKETVSRWERADKPTPMGRASELLLRLMVKTRSPRAKYPLRELGTEDAKPLSFRVTMNAGKWCAA